MHPEFLIYVSMTKGSGFEVPQFTNKASRDYFFHAKPNSTELPFHGLRNTDMMKVFHLSTSY
jgi:hypothetical protein